MSKILCSPGDDSEVLRLVRGLADPSLTEEEVRREQPPNDRVVTQVAPGVFLYDSGGGMSSKWLYYRKG